MLGTIFILRSNLEQENSWNLLWM